MVSSVISGSVVAVLEQGAGLLKTLDDESYRDPVGPEVFDERLEEAVTAYRAALEENTRERVPLDWAMTQMNLGNALEILGERETG